MKGGLQAYSQRNAFLRRVSEGFTTVEVLIVLAVTGILFVSAATLIGGKQSQAAFQQGVQQLQSQMQQVMNDVSSGFYPSRANFTCKNLGGTLDLSGGSTDQGTNGDCIFLGKVVQFGSGVAGTEPSKFATFSLAGLRNDASGNPITTLAATSPTVITSATTTTQLEGGLSVDSMWYDGNRAQSIAAVAFVSTLGQTSGAGVLSGAQQLNVIPIPSTVLTQNTTVTPSIIHSVLSNPATVVNPPNGVQVCFASGGTNQSGLLTIGGTGTNGRQLDVSMSIKSGRTC